MTRKPEHDQVSGLQFDGRISYTTITTWETAPFDPPERGRFIPLENDDAMEALRRMQCIIERNTDGGDYKDYNLIRNRLEQCAEYEKRIEGLLNTLEENRHLMRHEPYIAIKTAIKHMRGE